jgi:two-component system chemotaxis response regulator CheY
MSKVILTVDDSRTMRDMLRLALSEAGFSVVQAEDGIHGLEVLQTAAPDVIITDINMPRLDGFGFIEGVRKSALHRAIPVLVLTTESDAEKKQRARNGVHLMELLVNGLLQRGAKRERLETKLFGGAQVVDGLANIGAKNAEFAERFLRNEGISFAGGSLGGERGRRIEFWPVSGRARQIFLARWIRDVAPPAVLPKPTDSGSVEFFS